MSAYFERHSSTNVANKYYGVPLRDARRRSAAAAKKCSELNEIVARRIERTDMISRDLNDNELRKIGAVMISTPGSLKRHLEEYSSH